MRTDSHSPEAAAGREAPSLRDLRLLVGWLALHHRPSLEALQPGGRRSSACLPACELVFGSVAAACRCDRVRARLGTLLAAHLGGPLLELSGHPLHTLAERFERERRALDERALHAWLLSLLTHPSAAARPLKARVAEEIESRRAYDGARL